MWCVPELTREYVERMEDVLDLMEKPSNDREPVVAEDEETAAHRVHPRMRRRRQDTARQERDQRPSRTACWS